MLRTRLIALALTLWISTSAAQTVAPGGSAVERLLPLEVTVNGAKGGTWLFLERAGALYAPSDAYEEWRVQLKPSAQPILYKGQPYFPLSAVPGFNARLDAANQSVALLFSPQAFAATRMTQDVTKRLVISEVLPSLFFNYDLNYQASAIRDAPSTRDLGLLSELGLSTGWGVLTSSSAARNLTGSQFPGTPSHFILLETSFTRDFPDENRTLKLGDSITRAGMWGRNVYFGGVQYGTNFGLIPGFISQPLPVLNGVSTAPSTVELYVNDVLRQVSNVPTGPFAIDNFPLLTGNGEARLVVRDILGRETVIVQPFFTSSQLLVSGLNDWSVEAGALRRDFGTASTHYGEAFGTATWRHGYSDTLTLEGRTEATKELGVVGLGVVSALPAQMLGRVALVASHDKSAGSGGQWLVGLEHQGLRDGAAIQVQRASGNFRQLGFDVPFGPPKLQVAANLSYSSINAGTFGLGYAYIGRFDDTRVSTVSGNYTLRVGEKSSLTFTASRALTGASGSAVGVNFLVPLDGNRVVSATFATHDRQTDAYLTAAQNPNPDSGFAWRALAGEQLSRAHAEGGLYYLGRYGNLAADASTSRDQSTLRLGANGGVVLADGHLFVTRRVDESFAVAEVAGYGNVGIGLGSNVLTRTDAGGTALIPRLMAYQQNSVRIDPRELPVSAEIDSIEQVAVPAWRSGVKVVFPVRSGRGALLKIVFDDAQAAPAGALVQIEGDKETFYVARRGEAFVTGLQPANRLTLNWKDRRCVFDVALPAEATDEIARLGPYACQDVPR